MPTPKGDLADDDQRELAGGLRQGEQPGGDRRDGKAVDNQCGGIVGQTLGIEHDEEPARQAEAADDGERSDRVGRRHDGAEHEAEPPAHAEDEMRRRRHRPTGEDHATERQQRDRAQIEAKFAPAHGDTGRIDQRRQDAVEDEFRSKHDPRQAGKQRERNAGDHKQDRRRGLEPPRDNRDDHQHGQEQQNCFNRRRHGHTMPDIPERSSRLARGQPGTAPLDAAVRATRAWTFCAPAAKPCGCAPPGAFGIPLSSF